MNMLRAFITGFVKGVGSEELLLTLALTLIAIALWPFVGRGALLVPGAVIIWLVLPTRRAFIERPPTEPKIRRKA